MRKPDYRSRTGALALAAAILVTTAAPAPAQQDAAEQARLGEIARVAAQRFVAARDEAGQTRPTVPPPPAGGTVDLTLQEVTTRALERNLELAVERLNPQTFDLNIARLQATYRPTVNSFIRRNSQTTPPQSTLDGSTAIVQSTNNFNAGLSQAIPWYGGQVNLQFNNSRQATTNIRSNYNPAFNTTFNAQLTQPLLRGFLIDNTRQQLRVTAINREISEAQLRGTVATTLAAVRNAYWELVYGIEALEVARGSLTLAERLVDDNRARVEIGTMAPLDIVQAEAEVATRRQAVAQAEATWRTSELALKRLIVNGTDDPLWRASLNPVDRPVFAPEALDVEDAVRKALAGRSDLDAARRTVEGNNVTMRFLSNQRLPALDATAAYGATGLGGTQLLRSSNSVDSVVRDILPGGYGDAWRALTGRDYPTWNFAMTLSYPLGGSAADANYARARVQVSQATAQLRALELQVATDVTNAALQVENGLRRYEAAAAARQLAETRLDAEQSRFNVGLSTNFFVVQAQRDLATAQNSELRALLDYRRALVDYQRVQEAPAARGGGITTVVGVGGGGGFGN
jgi:outer membrane protein TolC